MKPEKVYSCTLCEEDYDNEEDAEACFAECNQPLPEKQI